MAYLGEAKTPEEFAAGHPNHPFARPGIHFVPKRARPSKSSSPPAPPTPEETAGAKSLPPDEPGE